MLLAIDIGNSNIVFCIYENREIAGYWRINSDSNKTSDEYGILFCQAIESANKRVQDIDGAIIASVVPPLTSVAMMMIKRYFEVEALIVDENTRTGLTVCYENPKEVGADRIVNAVSAFKIYGGPVIIVDFGTATTFCAVNKECEYLGGVIAPGIMLSLEALSQKAAKLPRIILETPERVIGRNTVASMRSGIIYGYAGLVDEVVGRMKVEMGGEPYVIATGGQAKLITPHTRHIKEINPMLTLEGLRLVYDMSRETV